MIAEGLYFLYCNSDFKKMGLYEKQKNDNERIDDKMAVLFLDIIINPIINVRKPEYSNLYLDECVLRYRKSPEGIDSENSKAQTAGLSKLPDVLKMVLVA